MPTPSLWGKSFSHCDRFNLRHENTFYYIFCGHDALSIHALLSSLVEDTNVRYIYLILSALLLSGCTSDAITGTNSDTSESSAVTTASKKAAATNSDIKWVPIKGTVSGPGTVDFGRTDCPDGTIPVSGEADGFQSHMGKITSTYSHCSYFFVDPSNPSYVDGWMIVIAANGDKIFGAYDGMVTGPTSFIDQLTITGGTGRFTDAEGYWTDYGTVRPTETGFYLEIDFEGMISSVGSTK
ncbi:MAG: hypothetical protein KJO98_00535 [Rhodothermia bacterium]|nr:hypothetical protein [Rhodothermia bacterium]